MKFIILVSVLVVLSRAQNPSYDWRIGFNKFDSNNDTKLTQSEFLTAFTRYDSNSDNVIEIGEFLAQYPLDTGISAQASLYMFFGLDIIEPESNKLNTSELNFVFSRMVGDDSEVSWPEYKTFMTDVESELREALTAKVRTDEIFDSVDADDDMNMSGKELSDKLAEFDNNGDKVLNLEEFKQFWGNDGTPNSDDNTRRLFGVLAGADGALSVSEDEVKLALAAFDQDDPKDGLVSKDEFDTALLKFFAQINNARDIEEAIANGEDPFGF